MPLWVIVLGISTGMRTMTSMAVLCWFGYLNLLPYTGWAKFAAHPVSVVVFTLFALGEYYGDTRPDTPSRTKLPLLVGRLAFGAVGGAILGNSNGQPFVGGALFGMVGVLIGAYGGVRLRLYFAKKLGRDLPVALTESAIALALAITAACIFHGYAVVSAAADRVVY